MVAAGLSVRSLGRNVLFYQCGAEGIAAVDAGFSSAVDCDSDPAAWLWINRIPFPVGLAGWQPYAVMALINNVIPFSLIVMGQTYIPGGMAAVVNATTPVFTVLVSAAFGEEKLIFRRVAGVLLGLCGVVILKGYEFDIGSRQSIGIVLCLGATVCFGFSALWARRKLAGSPPIGSATFQLLSGSLMMLVLASIFDRPWQLEMPGLTTWLAILGIASLSTALAFIFFFRSSRARARAT